MNILVVVQYYYPEQFRTNDICNQLVEDGHNVTVLTGIPNYPQGKYFDGYGIWKKRFEIHDGVKIIRSFLIPRGSNKLQLILNYLSFVLFGWLKSFKLTREKFDLVFVYETSPITMAIPAIAIAKRKKIPLIMYVTDLWPESVQAVGATSNKSIIKAIGKVVDYIYKSCDKILVSSHSFKDAICQRGHDVSKIIVWPQYAEELFQEVPIETSQIEKDIPTGFNIMFTGNIGDAQGLDVVIEAVKKLKDYPDIHWILIGDGRAKDGLVRIVEEKKLQNQIRFIEQKPIDLMPAYLSLADAALITLKKEPIFSMTIPAKLQSYMACGIPILACIDGEVVDIVRDANAGLTCAASDADGLARIALQLYSMEKLSREKLGKNANNYFNENYKRDKLIKKLYSIFEKEVR